MITGQYCHPRCEENYWPSVTRLECKGEVLSPSTWECMGGGIYAYSCPFLITLTIGFYVMILFFIFVMYKFFDYRYHYTNRCGASPDIV